MNPTFEPIIGSSFDNLAGQRQFWAGFNNRVDEANIARQLQAQQERNRWLAALAGMQRQDQSAADAQAESNYRFEAGRHDTAATQASAMGEKQREFDISAEIQRNAEKEKNDYLKWHYDIADKEKKHNLSAIENFAEFMAPDLADIGAKHDKSTDAYQKAINDFDTSRSAIEQSLPAGKVVYDARAKSFKPGTGQANNPEIMAMVNDANQKLSASRASFDNAKLDFQTSYNALEAMKKQAAANNLQVGRRGGKYVVYSPLHGKTFGESGSTATDSAPAAPPAPPADPSTAAWINSALNPATESGYAGFTVPGLTPMTETGTTPPPPSAPAAPAPAPLPAVLNTGRYSGFNAATPPDESSYPAPGAPAAPPASIPPVFDGTTNDFVDVRGPRITNEPPAGPLNGVITNEAPAGAALPLPPTKAQMIPGRMYQTARGIALWDGTKFVRL